MSVHQEPYGGGRGDAAALVDALGKLLLPSSDTPGIHQLAEPTARETIRESTSRLRRRLPSRLSFPEAGEQHVVVEAVHTVAKDPESLSWVMSSGRVRPGSFVAAGVSTVGLASAEETNEPVVGLGVEDLKRPATTALVETLREELDELDVRETGRIVAQQGQPPFGSINPLQPGCSVSAAAKSAWGTAGAIVDGPGSGVAVLSNAHVLDHPRRAEVVQPGRGEPGGRPQRVGARHASLLPSRDTINVSDAALAQLDDPTAFNSDVLLLNRPYSAPTKAVIKGTKVGKVGAASGLTYAAVDQAFTRVAAWYGNDLMTFADQYELVVAEGSRFSIPGDSGSIVWVKETYEPFALIFAGAEHRTWASPLSGVLNSFRVDLVGS